MVKVIKSINEKFINEFQMNDFETSIVKIEKEAEIIIRDKGCDYTTSLVYNTYYDKFLEPRNFFVEEIYLTENIHNFE